ncbi:Hypothetical predicted protein [Mytilus galloprovincialis]|uniref:C2H2-type domain-containing protein n=1 Tax=Mytilus galloprovincialis TaxID=29158 RepID=A0A8B6BPV3_MYTGA|nr:Hypothetical predicted protein [Mytilus galloprovincialis]
MRLCKGQLLRGEIETNENENQDDTFVPESVLPEMFNEELDSADNIVDQSDSRDESDYTGRPQMVNTNVTVRNRQDWRCHFCNTDCKTEGAWDVHTLKCAKEKREKEKFRCTESGCNYASSRKQDLNRHRKRVHGLEKSLEESDWETQNPGDLLDIIDTSDDQRMRKPTKPNPVAAPKRKQELNDMLQKNISHENSQSVMHCVHSASFSS